MIVDINNLITICDFTKFKNISSRITNNLIRDKLLEVITIKDKKFIKITQFAIHYNTFNVIQGTIKPTAPLLREQPPIYVDTDILITPSEASKLYSLHKDTLCKAAKLKLVNAIYICHKYVYILKDKKLEEYVQKLKTERGYSTSTMKKRQEFLKLKHPNPSAESL